MYPPAFGLRLLQLFDKIVSSRSNPPEIPDALRPQATQVLFADLPWSAGEDDLWEDACLVEALAYIRGNKSLDLGSWRPLFPLVL